MLFIATVFIILCCAIIIYALIKINNSFNQVLHEYEILEADLEGKRKALSLRDQEIECLKKELALLKEEKKVAKKESVKTVEELPKTEKVTKPRTRKTTTKK